MGDFVPGVRRGLLTGALGAPADLMAQLLSVPRMMGASTPDFREYPFMGSKNLGDAFERLGLLQPQSASTPGVLGELLGGIAAPGGVTAKGGALAGMLLAMPKNNVEAYRAAATKMSRILENVGIKNGITFLPPARAYDELENAARYVRPDDKITQGAIQTAFKEYDEAYRRLARTTSNKDELLNKDLSDW